MVFTAEEAEKLAADHRDVILVRTETSPEDIHGMHAARGILTARGGMTSHAAVVARGMGRPCVCGAGMLKIDPVRGEMITGGVTIKRGEIVTIDGTSGLVFKGKVAMHQPELTGDFGTLMGWADSVRRLKVRANADTEADADTARKFGAEGIGLCRTEHMFFEPDRILAVRQDDPGRRRKPSAVSVCWRNYGRCNAGVSEAIFRVMEAIVGDHPPARSAIAKRIPLPHKDEEIEEVARAAGGGDPRKLRARAIAATLHEANPCWAIAVAGWASPYPEIL